MKYQEVEIVVMIYSVVRCFVSIGIVVCFDHPAPARLVAWRPKTCDDPDDTAVAKQPLEEHAAAAVPAVQDHEHIEADE